MTKTKQKFSRRCPLVCLRTVECPGFTRHRVVFKSEFVWGFLFVFFFFCFFCWIRTLSKYINGEYAEYAGRPVGWQAGGDGHEKVFTVMREYTCVPTTYRYYHYYCCVLLLLLFGTRCARHYGHRSLLRCAAPRQRPRGTYTHTPSVVSRHRLAVYMSFLSSSSSFARVLPFAVYILSLVSCVFFLRLFDRTIWPFSFSFVKGRFRIDPNCLRLYDIIVRFKRAAAAAVTGPEGVLLEGTLPKDLLFQGINYRQQSNTGKHVKRLPNTVFSSFTYYAHLRTTSCVL